MLARQTLGYLLNGFLKLTCCVCRPWIRDARIETYGDAKAATTGYSFSSGHSTAATVTYGNAEIRFWKKKKMDTLYPRSPDCPDHIFQKSSWSPYPSGCTGRVVGQAF